jgi:hypothetical protein
MSQGTSSQRSTIGKQCILKSSKSVRPSSIFSSTGMRHGGTGTSDRSVRSMKMGYIIDRKRERDR